MHQAIRFAIAALATTSLALLELPRAHAAPAPDPEPGVAGPGALVRPALAGSQSLLAGLYVDGVETVESVTLRLDGATPLVELESLAGALDLTLTTVTGGLSITTPAGRADIPASIVKLVDGQPYVGIDALGRRMGITLRFDSSEYALFADTGWSAFGETDAARADDDEAPIDARAPVATVSEWRTEYNVTRRDGDSRAYSANNLSGGLGPGQWEIDLYDSEGADPVVQNASWLTTRGDTRYLVGQQQLALHPLLQPFEIAGAQFAHTNRADAVYGGYTADLTLVPNRIASTSVVRGEGPPGGTAELRVNGRAIEQRPIGLDGRYEFREVPAAPGDAIRVEVAVYEFGELGTPVRIDESYSQAADLQLPEGGFVHFGGVGANDNVFDDRDTGSGTAAFYQARYGLNRTATLDAIVQHADGATQGVVGSALNLGRYGAWGVYLGRGEEGALGAQIVGDGQWRDWFWRANAIDREAGYFGPEVDAFRTAYGEFGRRWGESLRVSLVGYHSEAQDAGTIDYLKPALDWRPRRDLSLSARPDAEGTYSYFANWYPRAGLRVAASRFGEREQLDVEQQLGTSWRVAGSVVSDEDFGERVGATVTRFPVGSRRLYWSLGALASEDRAGHVAELGLELVPGLTLRVASYEDPLYDDDALGGHTVNVSVIGDFALGAGGFARGDSLRRDQRELGGFVGGIVGELPEGLPRGALENIGVLVDGRVAGYTDPGGHYYLHELEPGVHRIELDTEALPIELVPTDRVRRAEVRAGRATRVDFAVALRLGLAGKLVDASGAAVPGAIVSTTVDERTIEATTSAYGFYRLDGLPPGEYRVAATKDGRTLAVRTVTVRDRFLFGIELRSMGNSE